jgi:hypothetical protein
MDSELQERRQERKKKKQKFQFFCHYKKQGPQVMAQEPGASRAA